MAPSSSPWAPPIKADKPPARSPAPTSTLPCSGSYGALSAWRDELGLTNTSAAWGVLSGQAISRGLAIATAPPTLRHGQLVADGAEPAQHLAAFAKAQKK